MALRKVTLLLLVGISTTLTACGQPGVAGLMAPQAGGVSAQTSLHPDTFKYPPAVRNEFGALDKNRDNVLTESEYVDGTFAQLRFFRAPTAAEVATMKAGFAKTFHKADKNNDNKLSLGEFAALSDKTTTPAEPTSAPAPTLRKFQTLDANNDGTLSKKEYVDGTFGQIRFVRAPSEAEVERMKAGFAKTFDAADSNKDGKLSMGEFTALEASRN